MFKITNSKHQITNKSQIPSLKFQTRAKTIFLFFCLLFVFSVIGIYLLFVFCYLGFPLSVIVICLIFGIYYLEFNLRHVRGAPLWGPTKGWFFGPGYLLIRLVRRAG